MVERASHDCSSGASTFVMGPVGYPGRSSANGFTAPSAGNRLKSRSAVHSACTPCARHSAAMRRVVNLGADDSAALDQRDGSSAMGRAFAEQHHSSAIRATRRPARARQPSG